MATENIRYRYKGRREFYRYLPKENPAMKLFAVAGITVDVSTIHAPMSIHIRRCFIHARLCGAVN